MRNLLILTILTFNFFLFAGPKSNNKGKMSSISTQQERQKFIITCQDFVNTNHELNFQINDLFIYSNENEEDVSEETTFISPEPVKNTVNEVVILKEVGQSLNPEGRIFLKGEYRLCIRGSRTLKVGDHLNANYNGRTFKITIKEISNNSFTLSLNQYSLSFKY